MEQRFTSREVVDATGITPRQLQWWDERGIVVPQREGRRRLYSLDDLAEVGVICELRRRAFSLHVRGTPKEKTGTWWQRPKASSMRRCWSQAVPAITRPSRRIQPSPAGGGESAARHSGQESLRAQASPGAAPSALTGKAKSAGSSPSAAGISGGT